VNRTKLTIRFAPGNYGGWQMSCPVCAALAVRKTWLLAMAEAEKHQAIHRAGARFAATTAPPTAAFRWLT
jgi:hypothetical protein